MNHTITFNGQTITVPEGMSVNLPINAPTHKTVRVPFGQKVDTKKLSGEVKSSTKAKSGKEKKVYDKDNPFLTKEQMAAIKSFFLAKDGRVTKGDADTLAPQIGLAKDEAGKIGYRFNQMRKAVCYGSIIVKDQDAFVKNLQTEGSYIAKMFFDPKVMEARIAKLAEAESVKS